MNTAPFICLLAVCCSCSRYHTDPITPVEMTWTAMGETFARIDIYARSNKSVPTTLEMQKLRAIELEAIQERVLASYEQDLSWLANELKRVQQVLRERDYGYVDTGQLYWYQGALMARIDKKCAPIEIPAPPDPDNSKPNKTEQNRTLLPGGLPA